MLAWWKANRKRLAPLVAAVAIAVIAGTLVQSWPREVELRFALGADHQQLREARIAYTLEGEEVKGVSFREPNGFGPAIRHRLELVPGRYDVEATLSGEGIARHVVRALEVPADGLVRMSFEEDSE